ncbi:MAG: nucleotide sugar dehydrogenase [Candidatus Omnitrophica bacterium]|nr:nucleotide sugar dehydrogenase [Candidatus Omnitrophota bacterium]MBU1127990.1 nucleotide sugar dehydrogenase [Candidatus Omnitrophota bacterium]MBU1783858.1 nucleotide sugar dehydrogenase [Candidatus Omnitrophota bacterium]MBU1851498.1 nucleotide sugar dehydrogenase [Candidatus Omnitrophota bacterium]
MSVYIDLKQKIKKKKAIITVMGLGYVGLPIALEFCKKGFSVNGLDTNLRRIRKLRKGMSYINDISDSEISGILKTKRFKVTADPKVLNVSDAVIMCVPTPLRKIKEPDISYVVRASKVLSRYLRHGQIVVLESTTYPGTTRDIMLPELRKSGLEMDKDFYLAFSPERIDPGNPKYSFVNIPKVIGGFNKRGTELGRLLYSSVIRKVVGVSNPEVAEVTKLLENTFRIVNIGLINEFAHLCHKLKIDVWEVIKAAKTKPFGFMPFYPGPGIGGHCIPADPVYLSWKARKVGFETRMVDLAAKVNRGVPAHIVERVGDMLKEKKIKFAGAKILLMGVTYKKDVNDLRESPALDIIEALKKKKVKLSYHDPFIPYLDVHGIKARSRKITPALLKKQDLVIVVTDHSDIDYSVIAKNAKVVFDTRDIFEKKKIKSENIVKL